MNTTIHKTELIDTKALKWLIKEFNNINIDRPISQNLENLKYGDDTDINKLKKMLSNCRKNGIQKTEYNQSKKGRGRYYVKGVGLSNLTREYRALLAKKNYYDLDIVNCDPTLLSQFCEKHLPSVDIQNLKNYVENRDSLLLELMNKNNIKKEEAKQIILTISKGGNNDYDKLANKPEWLINMKNEFEKIGEEILTIYKEEKEYCRKQRKYPKSLWGSVCSILIQDVENNIIQELDKYLTSKNFNVDVLIFDGVLVRNDKQLTPEILNELSDHINNKLGYKVKFLIKAFDESIKLPNNLLTPDEEYYEIRKEFEKDICKIQNPPQFLYLKDFNKKHTDIEEEDHEIKYMNKKQLVEAYEDYNEWRGTTGTGEKNPKSFIENWLKDVNKNSYEKIDFLPYPLHCPSSTFNLFKGFDIERIDNSTYNEEYVEIFKNHIKYLADDDIKSMEFVIKWFASIIQHPSIKTQVMICFKGPEGCGKNILFDIIGAIIGHKYYLATSDPAKDLFDKFNSCVSNKLLILLDESQQSDNNKFHEQLKARITNPKIQIQPKGKDIFTIRDFSNSASASNNDITFKISNKDRRFALFECTQAKKDEEYYNKLFNMKKNKDALFSIYQFLKSVNIEKYNFQRNRPITAYYKRCVEYFICNVYEYLNQIVYKNLDDEICDEIIKMDNGSWKFQASSFYKDYEGFCKQQKYIALTNKTFGTILTQIMSKTAINGCRYYIFNKNEVKDFLIKNNYWIESEVCLIDDSQEQEIEEEVIDSDSEEEEVEEVSKEENMNTPKDKYSVLFD